MSPKIGGMGRSKHYGTFKNTFILPLPLVDSLIRFWISIGSIEVPAVTNPEPSWFLLLRTGPRGLAVLPGACDVPLVFSFCDDTWCVPVVSNLVLQLMRASRPPHCLLFTGYLVAGILELLNGVSHFPVFCILFSIFSTFRSFFWDASFILSSSPLSFIYM